MAKMNPNLKGESKKEREMALIENGGQFNCVNCVSTVSAVCQGDWGRWEVGSLLSMFCGLKQRKKHPKSNLMS